MLYSKEKTLKATITSLHIGMVSETLLTAKGGSERVCANLANAMIERGHRVTIFSDTSPSNQPVYSLDPLIHLRPVPFSADHNSIHALRETLRQAKLDVCIVLETFGAHLLWAVALLGSGVPYIYSERSCPAHTERHWSRAGRLAAMSGADAVHLLLPRYAESLPDFLQERACCIPNPAPLPIENLTSPDGPPFILTSLGGLRAVKQIPLLIQAVSLISARFPDWILEIWGEGKEKRIVEAKIATSSARQAIHLCGMSDEPLEVFRRSHIFCISSLEEGMPNTVLEAMSCGLPVVGFEACSGVNSLVQNGINGLLAPEMTAESLAETLAQLMTDNEKRTTLCKEALKTAERYAPDSIYDQWENLFYQVAAYKGHTRMDAFAEEPFASQARLSAAARREWLYRDFGEPMPDTLQGYFFALRNSLRKTWRKFLLYNFSIY